MARSSSGFRKALSLIIVLSCLSFLTSVGNSKSRIYYIAADEIEWNYAPSDSDLVMGHPLTEHQREWVDKDKDRIGRIYKKAVYREYTDSTFSTLKPRGAEWDHLGLLGPVIRAEVGDTIHVFFKNNSTIVTSMHPHGVFYLKDSEGAPTNDGVNAPGGSVAPGQRHHYVWPVPERAGPGPNDLSSIVWVYHGHHDHVGDLYAGLIGPMIITRKGMALEDGRPKDVDREFINLFMIWDENLSPYLNKNIANYMRKGFKPKKSDHDHDDHDDHDHHMHDMHEHEEHAKEVDSGDEFDHDWDNDRFEESNKKHAINGYLFGNMPMMTMKVGEKVRWYLVGMGNEADIHTAHWHASTVLEDGKRKDVIMLLPSTFAQVDMVPDDPGIWMYHCHVTDHMHAGMMTRYQILPK